MILDKPVRYPDERQSHAGPWGNATEAAIWLSPHLAGAICSTGSPAWARECYAQGGRAIDVSDRLSFLHGKCAGILSSIDGRSGER